MPIAYQVTMYKCQHRCGRHSRNERFIAGHERLCWKNPKRKTCKTCIYEKYYTDSAGDVFGDGRYIEPEWYERTCKHPDAHLVEPILDEIYEDLQKRNPGKGAMYGIQIPPVVDCPLWVPRENDDLEN